MTVGSPDLDTTMKALRELAAKRGLDVLNPGRAVDQNAYAVSAAYAKRHRLRTLAEFGLVVLTDDKYLQNADHIVPVVNRSRAGGERVRNALDKLNTVLATEDLTSMNEQVDSWRRLPEDVAENCLRRERLIPAG